MVDILMAKSPAVRPAPSPPLVEKKDSFAPVAVVESPVTGYSSKTGSLSFSRQQVIELISFALKL